MVKQSKKIVKTTINRSEFNRAYKAYLENTGKIYCSRCPYHGGENFHKKKWYGGFKEIRYPNWKLVSKNRKQWIKKTLKFEERISRFNGKYIDITW
jgi:hypothetical protein